MTSSPAPCTITPESGVTALLIVAATRGWQRYRVQVVFSVLLIWLELVPSGPPEPPSFLGRAHQEDGGSDGGMRNEGLARPGRLLPNRAQAPRPAAQRSPRSRARRSCDSSEGHDARPLRERNMAFQERRPPRPAGDWPARKWKKVDINPSASGRTIRPPDEDGLTERRATRRRPISAAGGASHGGLGGQ